MTSPEGQDRTSRGARPSLFLERQSYRRRRLADSARLLPFLGGALLVLPLLWPDTEPETGGVPLSSAIFYIFACWIGLILVSLIFGFVARRTGADDSHGSDAG